jgi:Carbohydrate binding domain
MLKKTALVLLMAFGTIFCNAEETKNLIVNPDFAQGLKGWYVPFAKTSSSYTLKKDDDKNILITKGDSKLGKKNSYVKCSQTLRLPKDKVSGKKFTFGVTLKAVKVSGKLMFAIREIDAKGSSVSYRAIKLKKRDKYDWKKFTKTFTTSPKTVKLAVYVISSYLQDDDEIQAKDIFLHGVK